MGTIDTSFKARVLLVGDFVVDKFIYTTPLRVSREAPVLIVRKDFEEWSPGGGGNTAHNLIVLKCDVLAAGILGNDREGEFIKRFFSSRCDTTGLYLDPRTGTVEKTRILSGDYHTSKQQILRIDTEPAERPRRKTIAELCSFIKEASGVVDTVVVSDYGYYTFTEAVRRVIREISKNIRVVVDSRYSLKKYKGCFAATPNEGEALGVLGLKKADFEATKVLDRLKKKLSVEVLLLTRGNKGMILHQGDAIYRIPISGPSEVVDVSGAGDTVCAVFSAALASGKSPLEAALLANYAGGVAVMKKGPSPVSSQEIKKQMERHPVEPERIR